MRRILSILFGLLLYMAPAYGSETAAGAAALVNGAVISMAEYRGETARLLRQRKKNLEELDNAGRAMLGKEALETLIGRELLYQESIKSGIAVRDADVEAEIATLKGRFPDDGQFEVSLRKLNLTREGLASQIRRGIAIQALIEARFKEGLKIREQELRAHYELHSDEYAQPPRIHLKHILVKPGETVTSSGAVPARTRIEGLRRRIVAGEDFSLVARESDDPSSREKGGDLGFFVPGQLEKGMETVAFSLAVGQVSEVVEDRFGLHLLMVTERAARTVPPFEDVRERVERQVRQERLLAEVTPYVKRLRDTARIEIRLAGE